MNNTINSNSRNLCSVLQQNGQSTFQQLQSETRLGDTDLCLAICTLIMDGKILQQRSHGIVYYELK